MQTRSDTSAFHGVWTTVLCPVNASGQVDLSAIDSQVAAYAAAKCDGVYTGGTAAEFHSQSDNEFQAMSECLASSARAHGLPFQISAAHPLAPGSLARIAIAAKFKPDAIQVTLPDWTAIDLPTAQRFLERAAHAADGIPLVLYNPPHAKTVLSPDDLLALAKTHQNLIGLKCGGGDAAWYKKMAPLFDRLSVFIAGHHYASGTAQGAHGSYSNMACLSPRAAVAWKTMSASDAAALEARVGMFLDEAIAPLLARGLPGFACDKAMAAAGSWADISPRLLWPYGGATDDEVACILGSARRHIPEFIDEEIHVE
ncbi:MAG: dihydrodipicolinate synthase family protein [Hyphomicrobiales bacterium]